jgi:hypothetical protein
MVINITSVNSNLETFRPNTNKEKFSFTGSGQATVQRTNDVSQATKIETVTGETLTLAAGAAGTTGKTSTTYGPIMDSLGRKLGYFNTATDSDTSVSITHLALAGDEVRFDEYLTDTELYALLDNGDYTIDYTNAIIYYKKGTADTAGTINYKYTSQEIDLSGSTITIGAVDAKGIYNATEPTLTDGEKAQLQLNENGELKVTGGAGASSVSAEYISPSDFTATYTSSSSLTLSGVPITISNSSQIAYIKQVKADNTSRTYVNGANDITLAHAANVITIYEKGTAAGSLVAGDVYEVGINGTTKSYDTSTDTTKISDVTPESSKYVPDAIVNTTNLAAATHYFPSSTGMEMGGFNHLSIGGELIDADGNITLSVEVANNSDPSTAVWHQIYGYDMSNNTTVNQQAVASGTTSYFMDFEALNVTHVRFKVICSGATNTVKVMSRRKV